MMHINYFLQESYLYDKPSVHHSHPYQDTNMQALQLKQILLKNNTETEVIISA